MDFNPGELGQDDFEQVLEFVDEPMRETIAALRREGCVFGWVTIGLGVEPEPSHENQAAVVVKGSEVIGMGDRGMPPSMVAYAIMRAAHELKLLRPGFGIDGN